MHILLFSVVALLSLGEVGWCAVVGREERLTSLQAAVLREGNGSLQKREGILDGLLGALGLGDGKKQAGEGEQQSNQGQLTITETMMMTVTAPAAQSIAFNPVAAGAVGTAGAVAGAQQG
jgi:hypothetical protein